MIITLCGSKRFKNQVGELCRLLEAKGHLVLAPPFWKIVEPIQVSPSDSPLLAWTGATLGHFARIAQSRMVVVVNPGGYIGISTALEMGFCVASSKVLVTLVECSEPACRSLVRRVLETDDPAEAAQRVHALCRAIADAADVS